MMMLRKQPAIFLLEIGPRYRRGPGQQDMITWNNRILPVPVGPRVPCGFVACSPCASTPVMMGPDRPLNFVDIGP